MTEREAIVVAAVAGYVIGVFVGGWSAWLGIRDGIRSYVQKKMDDDG